MFASLKIWKLSGALKSRDAQEAYSAVLELGRIGSPAAVDALIVALARHDGVSRAAARELGRIGDGRAVNPLVALLSHREVNDAAVEALITLGSAAVDGVLPALEDHDPLVRYHAARALGEMGNPKAVDRLIHVLQGDNEYSVRTAAATALGQLKDSRAVWVLVGTLKLRDEASAERLAALESLREAANLALRKIGDPLAAKKSGTAVAVESLVEKLETAITGAELHPRLLGDISILSEADLVGVLRELIAASEEVSWAKLERRAAVLPTHFNSYDQRRRTAELVGQELQRRGGAAALGEVLERLNQYPAIQNWWAGLGTLGG